MAQQPLVSDHTIARGLKSIVDIGVPGFSLYIDNDVKGGAMHTIAGLGAGIAFGPLGVWLVAANSISRSASGMNLWDHFCPPREERYPSRAERMEHEERADRGQARKTKPAARPTKEAPPKA